MEQIDDRNHLVVKLDPERVSRGKPVVDQHILLAQDSNLNTLLKKNLLLVWMGRVKG